ncbi:MAG TPA: XdhC family protein [Puia sp.]|nr:XdhC family protein [Puia sp.]
MKELRSIVQAYRSIDFSKTRAALATVVRVEGSSYRRAGARMLVLDDGTYLGGISGGCLEGDALRRARKGIALNRPSVITYDTTQDDDYQIGVGLGCNGIIDVLFTPLYPEDPNNHLNILSNLTAIRQPAIVVAITGCPEKPPVSSEAAPTPAFPPAASVTDSLASAPLGQALLYTTDLAFFSSFSIKEIAPAVLRDIKNSLTERSSRTMTYDTVDGPVKVFIECILPTTHIAAFGGNHDILTLLRQAKEQGWDTTVVMNTAKAGKDITTTATRVLDSSDSPLIDSRRTPPTVATSPQVNTPSVVPLIDSYTAILLMSHDYKTDFHNLQQALLTDAAYIGLLGPRKRAEKMLDALAAAGHPVSPSNRQRLYAPAGLDIGAATPEEIALSILAEIRSHFAGRQGMSLRLREGTIYGNPTL